MALGKINKCWICYQIKAYKNADLKQFCILVKGKKNTLMEGIWMWLCKECR